MSYWTSKRVLLTGGAGFVGRHIHQILLERGAEAEAIRVPRRADCDLRRLEDAQRACEGVDVVIHAAAVVGGIEYNRLHPAEVYYNNAAMNNQVFEAARLAGVQKLVAVSSACAYPLDAPVPIEETTLFAGEPEPTNAPYGFAKRMLTIQARCYQQQYGIKCVVPVPFNAFGPGDDFDPRTSHVIPALIKKCFEDNELVVWGTGKPTRNFLYVEDFAYGIVLAAENLDTPEPVNIGTDEETSIRELVETIVELTGFCGPVTWDTDKPDGQPRRCADITKARTLLGYQPRFTLREGLRKTIDWYRDTVRGGEPPVTATT